MSWSGTLPVLLFLLPVISAQLPGIYDCPSPWLAYGDKCYKFDLHLVSAQQAVQNCETDGASLVSINSRGENDFIVSWLNANDRKGFEWLTSGKRDTRQDKKDKFNWEGDGMEVQGIQFWLNQETRERKGDRIVYATDGGSWGWALKEEGEAKPYICEISVGELYKIVGEERGYDYGLAENDPSSLQRGPKFILQPHSVTYDPDGPIKYVILECEADAIPTAQYEWYVDRSLSRNKISTLEDPRVTATNGKLVINSPKDITDNGDYQCVAANKFGAILSNSVQISFGYLNDFPKSSRDPVRVDAYTGIGIECNPPKHGYPSILYSWYKDSFRNFIRPALKPYVFISQDGKLYFSTVTKDDIGMYYCLVSRPEAVNSFQAGHVSMPIPLEVTESIGSTQEPEIVNGFPKTFPSSPKVGDDMRIECMAYGTSGTQQSLIYTWSKEGGSLPQTAYFTDHNRVLNIPDIQLMHAGTYKCTCKRWNGQSASNTVQVPVEAAPFFTIPLKDQHIDLGAKLTWRCNGEGIPTVTFQWYRNATELKIQDMLPDDASRYSINTNVLIITDVGAKDAGMYQCATTNTHGTRYSSAQLRILSFAPIFRKHPLQPNLYATLKGETTILCQPEAAPAAQKIWYKNDRPLNPSTDDVGRIRMLPNGNLYITSIEKSDAGMYKCEAENIHGKASSSGNLTVLASTTISYAPRDQVVPVNKTAFFHCEASYNPALDITYDWLQNNKIIDFEKVKYDGYRVIIIKEPYFERGTGINRGGLYITDAQFQHSGEYTCVVKSSSGSVSRTAKLEVIGPPSPPAGVFGGVVTSSSIELSWWAGDDHGSLITSYTVEAMNLAEGYWERKKMNVPARNNKNERVSSTVTGLSPYSQYRFRVRAVNRLGEGDPSDPSQIHTTLQDKPKVPPTEVGGGGGKVGDLTITWNKIPASEYNGEGVGYKVEWKKADMFEEDWEVRILNGPDHERYVHTVGSNNFYSDYDVRIGVFNDEGDGPTSDMVRIKSAEDIPKGTATNVRAVYYNSTAMLVEWNPVDDTRENMKGVLLGYRINYWIDEEEDETMAFFRVVLGQRDHGIIIGLEPNTYYQVNVQAINSAGNGPKSENYRSKTLRSAPMEAPQEVEVHVVNHQTIQVKWRGVTTTIDEEPLEGYMVRYWRRGENIYVATDIDAGKSSRWRVSGLETNTMYELRVFGYSRGGDGLQSSPAIEFVLGGNCYVQEDSPDKEYIYRCAGSGSILQMSTLLIVSLLSVYQLLTHSS